MRRVALCGFVCLAASFATPAYGEDRVVGSGHVNFEKVYGDVKGHRIFTVNVTRNDDGTVDGHVYDQYKVKEPSEGGFEISIKDHIRIDCLFIVGTTAFMSGVIEKEKITEEFGPPLVGAPVTLSVVDSEEHGRGRGRMPDMVSFSWVFPSGNPATCYSEDPRHNLRDQVTSGNLKVESD